MSCQTFPTVVCEQDCSCLYTLTVCPRRCAGSKRVFDFEVKSTRSTSLSSRSRTKSPSGSMSCIYHGGGELGGWCNLTSGIT